MCNLKAIHLISASERMGVTGRVTDGKITGDRDVNTSGNGFHRSSTDRLNVVTRQGTGRGQGRCSRGHPLDDWFLENGVVQGLRVGRGWWATPQFIPYETLDWGVVTGT